MNVCGEKEACFAFQTAFNRRWRDVFNECWGKNPVAAGRPNCFKKLLSSKDSSVLLFCFYLKNA